MTMFTYNSVVPFSTNNPSNDQPQMLINTISNFGIWNVDHVGFNSTNTIGNPNASGGQHLRVTFNGFNPSGALLDPISAMYTNVGQASTISQVYFRNQSGIIPISGIKAFGSFSSNGSTLNSVNCSAAVQGDNSYIITIQAGIIVGAGTNYGVIAIANGNAPAGFPLVPRAIIIDATSCNVSFATPATVGVANFQTPFTVLILQI